jgi:uncharacterized membrane protein HdeD (DUF308 family)
VLIVFFGVYALVDGIPAIVAGIRGSQGRSWLFVAEGALGVLWWTGSAVIYAPKGGVCGLAAAFAVGTSNTAMSRARECPYEWPSDGNELSTGGPDRQEK